MTIAIVAGVFALAFAFDFWPMHSSLRPGEAAVYLTILSVGFAVLMLIQLGVALPSPTIPIVRIIQALTGM
jgi:hypothetical protein